MTGNVVPFGRTPDERAKNAERARHPAGTKPAPGDAVPSSRWASTYASSVEERRANLLDASTCKVCERKFAHRTAVPADRVCRDCRYDMQHNGPTEPPPDPSLF